MRKAPERKPGDYGRPLTIHWSWPKSWLARTDFLGRMARSDDLVDHDGETCGMCHNIILGAQAGTPGFRTSWHA